jgi:phospholipase/carboxylesterase
VADNSDGGMARHAQSSAVPREAREGRLQARPNRIARPAGINPGVHDLGLAQGRDGTLYVPKSVDPSQPAPLVVALHGAGGQASHMLDPFLETAEARGYLVLAPESRGRTWDVILGGYGADVAFVDAALTHTFERQAIDPARIAVAGFSDGASYALSIGVINGELFSDIVAFSPGFMAPTDQADSPRVFISHGLHDGVLPIDACSRRLAPKLRQAGYDLDYREFDGGHEVPPEMVTAAVARFLS